MKERKNVLWKNSNYSYDIGYDRDNFSQFEFESVTLILSRTSSKFAGGRECQQVDAW
jgi:hypothetical protein